MSTHMADVLTRQALATAGALLSAAGRGDRPAMRRLLRSVKAERPNCPPDLEAIMHAAAIRYGCSVDQILGTTRARDIVHARMIVCYIATRSLGMASTKIGEQIGRDHSTVIHAVRRVEGDLRMRTIAEDIAGQLGWAEAS